MRRLSAYFWQRVLLRLLAAVGIWGGALAILSFAKSPAFWPQTVGIPGFIVGVVGTMVVTGAFALSRNTEELDGFTTLNGYARNLQQRDPHSGSAIREAGEPFLDAATFKSLIAESRKAARGAR